MRHQKGKNVLFAVYKSPLGDLLLFFSHKGLTEINFIEASKPFKIQDIKTKNGPLLPVEKNSSTYRKLVTWLDSYFRGEKPKALSPAFFDFSGATEFQINVWKQLLQIPFGNCLSYGELAQKLGDKNLSRAVGGANGKNFYPLVIPCHRVIAANGKLGGFSGGLDWKKKLLSFEGHKTFL